jgi:hypothetical protein
MNREVIRTIYKVAKPGALSTATAGTFDLDVDSNGRWSVERFKGLMFQIERDANVIAQDTRRGRGNFIICSSDVAAALAMTGKLDYAPALSGNDGISSDDTGNTFAGTMVVSRCSLTHTRQIKTLLHNLWLLDTRETVHMTQVSSTAHTFRSKWFVPLTQLHSNPRLDSRHVTA